MRQYRFLVLLMLLALQACSQGNYPEAGSCTADYPFFAVCTHGEHGVGRWSGACRATREQALEDAHQHAVKNHGGNERWTGISDINKAQLLVR